MRDWVTKYWLSAVFGAITGAMGWAFHRLRKRQNTQAIQQTAIKEGMLALLHDRIYSSYRECAHKGFITVDELSNLEYLYKPYATLGGNGTGEELYRKLKSMPTEPPQAATA